MDDHNTNSNARSNNGNNNIPVSGSGSASRPVSEPAPTTNIPSDSHLKKKPRSRRRRINNNNNNNKNKDKTNEAQPIHRTNSGTNPNSTKSDSQIVDRTAKPKNNSNNNNNNNNNNRRKNRNRTRNEDKKTDYTIDNKPKSTDQVQIQTNLKQRNEEIQQCETLLGPHHFKLFKKGKFVTSYGITFNNSNKVLGKSNIKFIMNVPLNYPQSPIKLSPTTTTAADNNDDEVKDFQNLINNFNYMARTFFLSNNFPIISQLNFLIQQQDKLILPNYKEFNKLQQTFYSKFV
ncbi:Smu2p NDAI_0K02920 [Naumovozyma dairenensis CBS 421]|uniref:RWD domain-containing protein n=1 Tax=Naumovozyma dairenensis (strain ATCC 10597 / BCRC 20456 / CBS 421 / NBRC 0211 / NRRL Y-12639) TaxID=1071378 RepID=G0WI72_NAUDC|nr:hypothetical protein NDAI_0K02920 [Naumovozyma dairenensis CBS 421]CCD27483.1 hypothetical protein NDAI_0K02920 [Naumovozyma dairenensis CBS 421]